MSRPNTRQYPREDFSNITVSWGKKDASPNDMLRSFCNTAFCRSSISWRSYANGTILNGTLTYKHAGSIFTLVHKSIWVRSNSDTWYYDTISRILLEELGVLKPGTSPQVQPSQTQPPREPPREENLMTSALSFFTQLPVGMQDMLIDTADEASTDQQRMHEIITALNGSKSKRSNPTFEEESSDNEIEQELEDLS